MLRNNRPDYPHGGVLIAAKKDLELNDIKCSKDLGLLVALSRFPSKKRWLSYRTTDHPINLTSHT